MSGWLLLLFLEKRYFMLESCYLNSTFFFLLFFAVCLYFLFTFCVVGTRYSVYFLFWIHEKLKYNEKLYSSLSFKICFLFWLWNSVTVYKIYCCCTPYSFLFLHFLMCCVSDAGYMRLFYQNVSGFRVNFINIHIVKFYRQPNIYTYFAFVRLCFEFCFFSIPFRCF